MKRADVDRLEQMLREEGRRDTPAFSIPLHERTLVALRTQGLPQPAARPATRGGAWMWKVGLPVATAAALAVVAWIVLHQAPPKPAPSIVVDRPTAPQIVIPDLPASPVADDQLNDARFAYLDRDAMKFWTFLADQLPQLPDPDKRR
jgi:hypothetical protein